MSLDPPPILVWWTVGVSVATVVLVFVWVFRIRNPLDERNSNSFLVLSRWSTPGVVVLGHFMLAGQWGRETEYPWLAVPATRMAVLSSVVGVGLLVLALVGFSAGPAPEQPVQSPADAAPVRPNAAKGASAAEPRLTRGQYRYVMRHASNFRMGNRRGKRLF